MPPYRATPPSQRPQASVLVGLQAIAVYIAHPLATFVQALHTCVLAVLEAFPGLESVWPGPSRTGRISGAARVVAQPRGVGVTYRKRTFPVGSDARLVARALVFTEMFAIGDTRWISAVVARSVMAITSPETLPLLPY